MNIATITNDHYLPEKTKRRRANTVAGYESSLTFTCCRNGANTRSQT